jgi:cbb3-type cytochrome oxidase subunit 3
MVKLSGYAILKTLALLIFFGAFMFILLRLIFTGRSRYDDAAKIPLDDESGRSRESGP